MTTMLSCSSPDDLFAIRIARHRAVGDALVARAGGVRERVTVHDGETTLLLCLDGEAMWLAHEERRGAFYVWCEDFVPHACPPEVVDACRIGDVEIQSLNFALRGWAVAPILKMIGVNKRAKFYVSAHKGELALVGSGDTATAALDELQWRIEREKEAA